MKKIKRKPDELNLHEIDSLVAHMLNCAKCLEGAQPGKCKNEQNCDKTVMDSVVKALDMAEGIQQRTSEKARQTVRSKMSGFRCQNILTKEYQNKVAKALAESAMELRYSADVITGRDMDLPTVPEDM